MLIVWLSSLCDVTTKLDVPAYSISDVSILACSIEPGVEVEVTIADI